MTKRQSRKAFTLRLSKTCKKLGALLRRNGFIVYRVKALIDDSCSPEVGFIFTMPAINNDKQRIDRLLRNYAYGFKFV